MKRPNMDINSRRCRFGSFHFQGLTWFSYQPSTSELKGARDPHMLEKAFERDTIAFSWTFLYYMNPMLYSTQLRFGLSPCQSCEYSGYLVIKVKPSQIIRFKKRVWYYFLLTFAHWWTTHSENRTSEIIPNSGQYFHGGPRIVAKELAWVSGSLNLYRRGVH
jgi:hypothetical protein